MPLQAIAYVTPFVTTDSLLMARTVDRMAEKFPAMKQAFARYNQVYLTNLVVIDSYQLFFKKPVASLADLKGRKIGGAGINLRYVKALGAVGVSGPLPKYYNMLKTGIVDGAMLWPEASVAFKIYEVGPYMLDARIGAVNSKVVSVNADTWKKLPAEVKNVLAEAAIDYRDHMAKVAISRGAKSYGAFEAKGGKIICAIGFDYSEKVMINALRKMPSGKATTVSIHDPVPGTPEEGIPIKVGVKVDSADARIEIDLRDNPDTVPCGLNLSEACARTAAMIATFNSIEDPVPTNAGSFRRIDVLIRDGCVAGGGKHPTSMSVATTNLADRVTNPTQRAFSQIKDGIGLAECGPFFPASMGVISGLDPRNDNAPFVNQIFMLDTGGAAAAKADAWLTICHAGNSGLCFVDSVELDELHFPVLNTLWDSRCFLCWRLPRVPGDCCCCGRLFPLV